MSTCPGCLLPLGPGEAERCWLCAQLHEKEVAAEQARARPLEPYLLNLAAVIADPLRRSSLARQARLENVPLHEVVQWVTPLLS
jgi:hypothetical protein